MDFGKLLKTCWDSFIKEIVNLILFALLGVVLCLTIVLIPTVAGGWTRGVLGYVREGKRPDFNALWNFDGYFQILLLMIVQGLLVSLGFLLLVVPGVILSIWWLYTLFFLVDRNLGFWEAMSASREAVSRTGFFNHSVVFLIVCVLNALGSALSGLGTLVTLPFTLVLLSQVYLDVSGTKD
jgi:hypothetical protein